MDHTPPTAAEIFHWAITVVALIGFMLIVRLIAEIYLL